MTDRIPRDIYNRCTILAKSYYLLLARRREREKEILFSSPLPPDGCPRSQGTGDPTARKAERLIACRAELDRKIQAVQDAMEAMPDDAARSFIRKNLFERIPMDCTGLPIPRRTMCRIRRSFILQLAKNLSEM